MIISRVLRYQSGRKMAMSIIKLGNNKLLTISRVWILLVLVLIPPYESKANELVNEESLIDVGENDLSKDGTSMLNCSGECDGDNTENELGFAEDDTEMGVNTSNISTNHNDFDDSEEFVVPKLPDYLGNELSLRCEESTFGCCEFDYENISMGKYPAHGPNQLGCCASGEYHCCMDDVTAAEGPYNEGCPDCKTSEFGCCPDNLTPAKGHGMDSDCGCKYSEHGCCPDTITQALGTNFEGCGCETFEFGCCSDGVTVAKGPNLEGCAACNSVHGCCPDDITPKDVDEVCGCEASKYGCCMDGNTTATGPNFKGCSIREIPGQMCHLSPDPGPCRDFVPKWFYDTEYGGCNRYWYGGCKLFANDYIYIYIYIYIFSLTVVKYH